MINRIFFHCLIWKYVLIQNTHIFLMIYGDLFLEICDQLIEAEVESSGDRIELASCSKGPTRLNMKNRVFQCPTHCERLSKVEV